MLYWPDQGMPLAPPLRVSECWLPVARGRTSEK